MDPEILKRLEASEKKLEQIYSSVEKTRKYMKWTFIVGILVTVLPLIVLAFVLPVFLKTYLGSLKLY